MKNLIYIHHSDLKRSGESAFRSVCPSCETGILLVRRNQKSLKLSRLDNCINCGQEFFYIDDSPLETPVDRGSRDFDSTVDEYETMFLVES